MFRFPAIRNVLKSSKDLTTLVTYIRTKRRKVGRERLFSSYLKANPIAKLQLGAGANQLAGWLNTDQSRTGFYLDLTEPFPFPDNSFSYIMCEALANVGFREICRVAVGASTDENLRGVDARIAPEEAHLSLVVEAMK